MGGVRMKKKVVLIFVGPSGSGKDSIVEALLEGDATLRTTQSLTTRTARPDDKRYTYVRREDFQARIKRDEFAEWKEVHGEFYGTPHDEITREGDIVMQIDIMGALDVRKVYSGTKI